MYNGQGGPDYNRENESWNVSPLSLSSAIHLRFIGTGADVQNGPPPFTPQNPYGVYPDGQQGPQGYNGTPNHHPSHDFPDQQTTPHGYSETPNPSHSTEDF
jgi:hypothetical protein